MLILDFRIRPDLEFRCFVNKKAVTAISQYDPIGYFPHVVKQQDTIKKAIFDFFETIAKYLLFYFFNSFKI